MSTMWGRHQHGLIEARARLVWPHQVSHVPPEGGKWLCHLRPREDPQVTYVFLHFMI